MAKSAQVPWTYFWMMWPMANSVYAVWVNHCKHPLSMVSPVYHAYGWCHLVHIWHIYWYTSHIYTHQIVWLWYICPVCEHICFWHIFGNNVWHFCCSGLYLVDIGKNVGLYAHIVCWLCEVYLQCGSCICSVIYVKYVFSVPCHRVDGQNFI